jgi:hypothetical protein
MTTLRVPAKSIRAGLIKAEITAEGYDVTVSFLKTGRSLKTFLYHSEANKLADFIKAHEAIRRENQSARRMTGVHDEQ